MAMFAPKPFSHLQEVPKLRQCHQARFSLEALQSVLEIWATHLKGEV